MRWLQTHFAHGSLDWRAPQLLFFVWHAVLTKADAIPRGALEAAARNTAAQLAKLCCLFPVLSAVSAHTGEGLQALTEMVVFTSKLHRRERKRARRPAVAHEVSGAVSLAAAMATSSGRGGV